MRIAEKNRPHAIKTWRNANDFAKTYEFTVLPSETIPDETMSLREIVTRYSRGLPIEAGGRTPIWAGGDELTFDDYLPSLAGMDMAERQMLMEQARFELDEIKKKANEVAKQRKLQKEAEKDELSKLIEQKIAAASGGKTPPAPAQ